MARRRIPASVPPLTALAAAAVVFVAVMLATPPGFSGLRAMGPGAPRSIEGYAAAYALGAAAGLGLLTLLVVAGVLAGLRALPSRADAGTTDPIPMDGVKSSESVRADP